MCHAPTREIVCLPPAGKGRAQGQALPGRSLGGRRKLLPQSRGSWAACRPPTGRPGEPRTSLGIVHFWPACPEHILIPEALRHAAITLDAMGSCQRVLSRGVTQEAVQVMDTNLAAQPRAPNLAHCTPKNSLGMIWQPQTQILCLNTESGHL